MRITAPLNHQAHHIVPSNVVQNSLLHQEAMRRGLYDVDRAGNGKFLAETDEDFAAISTGFPTHLGSHPDYDELIKRQITIELANNNLTANSNFSNPNLSNQQILDIIDDIEESSLSVLINWTDPKLH